MLYAQERTKNKRGAIIQPVGTSRITADINKQNHDLK